MGLSRDDHRQLQLLLRPLFQRVASTVARGVVRLVTDAKKLQLVQLGVLAGETIGDAEHFQPYGFSSVPLAGAEAVVVFQSGDRARPMVVSISDRRHRPTDGEAGEVTMYAHTGAKVTMLENGNIEVQPAPGAEVLIRDEGGSVDRVVKRGEFLAHGHPTAGTGPVSPPTAATPIADTGQFPGTQRLRVQ